MKKIFLSLTLLSSAPLLPTARGTQPIEAAPEPAVQDATVREAVDSVENSQVVPDIVKLEGELSWSLSREELTEITAQLGFLIARKALNKHNFQEQVKWIITQMVAKSAYVHAKKHVCDPSAARIANSMGKNVKGAMDRIGIEPSAIDEYFGGSLESKVRQATHHNNYSEDRHCKCRWGAW